MPNNLTSTLIDELGQAIRTIDGTGDFTKDLSSSAKMFYQMDRPDFERILDAAFPRVLILVKDLSRPEMLNSFNVVNMQINIILQFKQDETYNADLASGQELLNAAYDIARGVRAWQEGIKLGTYTINGEIIGEVSQEIGRTDRLLTIETIFPVRLDEDF